MSEPLPGVGAAAAPRRSASHGEAGYARRAGDAYFTEPWVTRALLGAVRLLPSGNRLPVWEPACGDGRMAAVIAAAGYAVRCTDIRDYGCPGATRHDFLRDELLPCHAVVTNPPFALAAAFIYRALKATRPDRGLVAMLQRHEFDAPAINRPLFAAPFAAKLVLHKRPRWSDDDKASPRFPYAWYLWDWAHQGEPALRWLPDPDKPAPAGGRLLLSQRLPHRAYAAAELRRDGGGGWVCPHRRAPLASCPIEPAGTIVCPLRGLAWRAADGRPAARGGLP